MSRVRKAVFPAAGLGTRFLPATKAQPKEMLPVVDKPAIQYVVEEAVASGMTDIIIITGRGKRAIEDHFDKSYELEHKLRESGNSDALAEVQRIASMADIFYIRQKEQLGLGHAILCAKKHVGNEPFAVMLGDDIVVNERPCIGQLVEAFDQVDASVVGVEQVPKSRIHRYGVIKGKRSRDDLYKIEDLVEKPSPEEAPSDLAIIGRYVLTPDIFDVLAVTKPGRNQEIQLTDALKLLLERQPIYAYEFEGIRYDAGTPLEWLEATVMLALQHPEWGNDFKECLRRLPLT